MKKVLTLIVMLAFSFSCQADETAPEQEYTRQGTDAAAVMLARFDAMDKPKFQKAYDDYLKDLEIIAETGRAADNQELFNDLLEMNSEEEVVYSHTKGSIRTGFGHLMRSRRR